MPEQNPIQKPKSVSDTLTEMQSEMKSIAEAESKKPFGGNMRSAVNQLKAKAAEEDQKARDYAENVAKSVPSKAG
jgi:hypothetical protein